MRATMQNLADEARYNADRYEEQETLLTQLVQSQGEMTGRMQTMAEIFGSRQSDLMRLMNDRMEGLGKTLGTSVLETHRQTHNSLSGLQERLALIDNARQTMGELSAQVVDLKKTLSGKQARGAYGQAQMEEIIADSFPKAAYKFQAQLSNGTRPDCLIIMPGEAPPLVVDAKYPLEAFLRLQNAKSKDEERAVSVLARKNLLKHVEDIASKYLLAGETQEYALMYIPSESLFAQIHSRFAEVIEKAHRQRVLIVSPSLLLMAVQLIRTLVRDTAIQSQARTIQLELGKLLDDVARMSERSEKLQTHFTQAQKDVDQLGISCRKVISRTSTITQIELGEEHGQGLEGLLPKQTPQAPKSRLSNDPLKPVTKPVGEGAPFPQTVANDTNTVKFPLKHDDSQDTE
ncbi:DNA recombination protein RmuC [Polycladidibacter stylochi]|uniref:DNA recombination protein RmuC n=1 Tax=Polycladidibacter stylochi TaxID=1807766 RepID=UPI00138F1B1C|nr:DNA recombination protein RmuC [Pseudovibrio stylochi]